MVLTQHSCFLGTLSTAVASDVEPEETGTHIQRDRGL